MKFKLLHIYYIKQIINILNRVCRKNFQSLLISEDVIFVWDFLFFCDHLCIQNFVDWASY